MRFKNKYVFVRHAESVVNKNKSNNKLPISRKGVKQAKRLKKNPDTEFDYVYCSTAKRTELTANILSDKEPIRDKRLLEKGWGNTEENGMESKEEAQRRVVSFLSEVETKHSNKKVLVVTHGSLIKLIKEFTDKKEKFENTTHHDEVIENCSTYIVEPNEKQ